MKKIVFLEGLPGVGKSTIIKSIKQRGIPYVNCVEELINEDIFSNRSFGQEIFMKNDDIKIDKFSDGLYRPDAIPPDRANHHMLRYRRCVAARG